jgi:hypothetical protein
MKYILIISIIIVTSLSSVWYGFKVGLHQGLLMAHGNNASEEMNAIENLVWNEEANARDIHEVNLNNPIVIYGEYLQTKFYFPLFLGSKDDVIDRLYVPPLSYRRANPRIINGAEASPSKLSLSEIEKHSDFSENLKRELILRNKYYQEAMKKR